MTAKVQLSDILDALEMPDDDYPSFVNRETGEVETISRELLSEAEEMSDDDDEDPDLPDLQDDEWEVAKQIAFQRDNYVILPDKHEIHEWEIMRNFVESTQGRLRDELRDAIHGAGAFRSFKSAVRRNRVEDRWFAFRAEALKQIAIEWCEDHQVEWE